MDESNYIEINKQTWNNKVPVHVDSSFYDVERFLKGKNMVPKIDLDLLGDLNGKSLLHCNVILE